MPDHGRQGLRGALVGFLVDDLRRWSAARRLQRAWNAGGGPPVPRPTIRRVGRLVRREMALAQQLRLLGATQRLFRFWHVAHRPLTVAAFIAVAIHVVVVVALGVTWVL
jgi:hypothetical protein